MAKHYYKKLIGEKPRSVSKFSIDHDVKENPPGKVNWAVVDANIKRRIHNMKMSGTFHASYGRV